ncbi:MAG: hypothetical protein ABEI77_02155 [Halorientalis sp.]
MTTRTVEQVGDWESRSFSGGYRGLHDLSDERFSGIVTAGPTRLCMTKGTVVGVLDGDIEDFEDASGTVHEAPSPALPLLAVMQERSDEVRAQYYTEETPVREVDQTLSDGNFTGFVELSENVLSGDYFIVYHQGRSMNVAWVGESKQLLTEDEAFERTSGEVGIYKVKPVDIDVIEIPEAADPAPDDTGPADEPDDGTGPAAVEEEANDDEPDAEDDTPGAETDAESGTDDDSSVTDPDRPTEPSESSTDGQDPEPGTDSTGTRSRSDQSGAGGSAEATNSQQQRGRDRGESGVQSRETQQSQTGRASKTPQGAGAGERTGSQAGRGTAQSGPGGVDAGQRETAMPSGRSQPISGLETRSIPSLDPDRTSTPSNDQSGGPTTDQPSESAAMSSTSQTPTGQQQPTRQSGSATQQSSAQGGSGTTRRQTGPRQTQGQRATHQSTSTESAGPTESAPERSQLESELADREAEIEQLETELETVEGERDDLEAELEDVRAERDELQERIERLERRVNELRTEEGGESIADRRRMSPGEVIDGTNLFVRYGSKGAATLEAAYNGNAEPTAVNDNLDIQHHTQFEADDVAVNGEPFAEFLHGTLQYQFVEWMVRVLPYEVRDTGHQGGLSDLYEALPEIDRAELNGTISVVFEEDGQEQRSQERFDVVLRDRMGNPLAVANMNESRQPASQSMMESLITASQRVGESKESLAGAFLVTSSFFEPEAMEAAKEATGSGLLSRDKRESFVKLSRKDGYHLCLVQYLDGQFELSVPEL